MAARASDVGFHGDPASLDAASAPLMGRAYIGGVRGDARETRNPFGGGTGN